MEDRTLEEQIQAYRELHLKIGEMEEKKKELGVLILQQMTEKVLSVAGYTVRSYSRLSIKTSLEDARNFNATRMEEVVDKDKLKELHTSGQTVPGISPYYYIQVSQK